VQELAATQVEHKLREETKLARELEAGRVVLLVLSEASYKLNEHAVKPANHVNLLLSIRFEDRVASHEYGCRLLVEAVGHLAEVVLRRHEALDGGHAHAP